MLTGRTGKDYLYSRFRPGLTFTLVFLFLFISGMQYVFHALTASRQRAHINKYILQVKEVAWGPYGGNPPSSGARKYVSIPDQSEDGTAPPRRFVIDFAGNVYFIDPDSGAESLLDVNEIEGASWKKTMIYALPVSIWKATGGRLTQKSGKKPPIEMEEDSDGNNAKENEKSNGVGKYTKAEKVGGRRKAKKRS